MRALNRILARLLLISIVLGISLAQGADAEKDVQGDKGAWRSFWHGVGDSQKAAYDLPRSCAAVVKALDAAKAGDFPLFCSCFEAVDTNRPPTEVKTWFDDWKAGMQQYIYLIGQEALLGSEAESNVYAAVSIVPCALRDPARKTPDLSQLKADVIFARKTGDDWKLLPEVLDRKLAGIMVERAAVFKYKPNEFSKEALARDIRKFHQEVLEDRRKKGASTMELVSTAETFQLMENEVHVRTWSEWTNYYHAVVLDPPVAFDIRTNASLDFSTPVSACRSYLRSSFLRDRDTLLRNADPSEAARVERSLANDSGKIDMGPRLAFFTILLTATTTLDGKDYGMVLWRSQNAEDPTHDLVGFQKTFLVYSPQKKSYLVTQNLRDSTFASFFAAAGAPGVGLGKYDSFYSQMKASSFPTNFYNIR